MKKYRITYKERKQDGKAIVGHIATLDAYDCDVDEGFVYIWFDNDDHGADLALNANSVYKFEKLEEE